MGVSSWIRRDGLLHMETCALIVIVAGLAVPWWVAGLVGLCAGIGKELWDKRHNGVPSWHDVICDCIGILLGMAIAFTTYYSELMFYD